jgi:putative endonuclease
LDWIPAFAIVTADMNKGGFVYIMASRKNGTIYIGVTSDLPKRAWEHREGRIDGFTKKYGCKTLVWFEQHDTIEAAITRERQMKEWKRAWKLREIEEKNPNWDDLFELVCS